MKKNNKNKSKKTISLYPHKPEEVLKKLLQTKPPQGNKKKNNKSK